MPLSTFHRWTVNTLQIAKARWRALSLSAKFMVVAIVPIGCNLLILGGWVSSKVAEGIIQQNAADTALYFDSFVEPLIQDLASSSDLAPPSIAALQSVLTTKPLTDRISNFKIWNRDGRIIFSTQSGLIGKVFPPTPTLLAALNGRVMSEYDDLTDDENAPDRHHGNTLLEIYIPLHVTGTGRVIAVAEVYEIADQLRRDLAHVRMQTWAIVSALSAAMMAMLLGIVMQGSKTIGQQREALRLQITELSRLLHEVTTLRGEVDSAHQRAAESTERFIRRVGSDLHDGPAQHIGVALLHIEDLHQLVTHAGANAQPANDAIEKLDDLLSTCLDEIRAIAVGLAPPELEKLAADEALQLAARNHEWRTGTPVATSIGKLPDSIPPLLKIALYRFVQEGLNNAYNHAEGIDQSLRATCEGGALVVEVSDGGPGIQPADGQEHRPKLGLSIMRDRIESLGGTFEIETAPGAGTRVMARFNLETGGSPDGVHSHRSH